MSLSVLYTLLSPDRDEAGSVDPVRAHPHLTVTGSYYLWSHLAEAEAKPESSFNKWQHLCAPWTNYSIAVGCSSLIYKIGTSIPALCT